MAWQLDFTDPDTGANYPESYWHPAIVALEKPTESGNVVFYGYATAQSRLDGRQSVAIRAYRITAESFATYFDSAAQNPEGVNPYSAAYLLAAEDEFFVGAVQV